MSRNWGLTMTDKEKKQELKEIRELLGDDDSNSVEVEGNHIYFYNGVDFASALKINKTLHNLSTKLVNLARANGFDKPTIHLHINSGGGSADAGIAIMDTILHLRKDIDVYTYVEGMAASAATLISLVGTKRFITRHSSMLIHQLAAGTFGKYREMKDDMENFDLLMGIIKKFYSEYTKIDIKELDAILDHDIFWDAEKCLELGMVDEIL